MKNNKAYETQRNKCTRWGRPLLNKGFTLIELLAVIVILAIIAVIAVPQILNLINNSKKEAAEISAENYLRAVEVAVMNKDTDIEVKNLNGTYKINEKGKKLNSDANEIAVEFDGKSNFEGYITITNYKITSTDISVDDFSINYIDGQVSVSKKKEVEKSILIKGQEFNSVIKSLVNEPNTSYKFTDEKVISIDFYSNGLLPSGYTKESLELLPKESVSINNDTMAYNDNGKIYIISDKLISFNRDSSWMFYNFKTIDNIIFRKFDTSSTKNMQYLFWNCSSLTKSDVSDFDTSNVENMAMMFQSCKSLEAIDVSKWNTSNVTSMQYMFAGCISLTSLNVSNFTTSNVLYMHCMFQNCSSLTNLDVSKWNVSKVTYMYNMFQGCSSLTSLNLNNWNTQEVTTMSHMFGGCSSLTELNISNFNTSKVKNMTYMFSGCSKITSLDVSKFDTREVTSMSYMFNGCSSLTSIDVSNFNTKKATTMQGMFMSCKVLTTINIGCDWKTAENITNMFYGSSYTQEQFNALIEQTQSTCSTT